VPRRAGVVAVLVALLSGCWRPAGPDAAPGTPEPVIWTATASAAGGGAPDAASLRRARDMVAARLRVGDDLPPTRVSTAGDRTLVIRLEWEDDFGWEVAERLRPGRLLLRPVREEAVEPAELRDAPIAAQPRPDQLAAIPAPTQFAEPVPTCALLLARPPADTADPAASIASCGRDHTLASTKYLLGPAALVERDIAGVRCTTRPDTWSELTISFARRGTAAAAPLAVVLDGHVLATVRPKAGDDRVSIGGYFMSTQAAVLCGQPRYAPLPVDLRPEFPS
jgi:hypothetical protein